MKNFTTIKFLFFMSFLLFPFTINNAQVQRNPVIEACTGTWCQYCPCGHDVIDNILLSNPNVIAVEYHGPASSADPWRIFPGNEIISLMNYTGYPTAVIDRTGLPLSRSAWAGVTNQRLSLPAAVDITMDKVFNKSTGALDVTIHSEAQANLTGEYKLSFIILESGLIYPQTGNTSAGCIGGNDYVHNHVVRAMINGAQGESLTTGPWNSGATISKSIQYSVPSTFDYDNCELVAFVYKVAAPLYSAEIAQGQKWPLVSPDYVASVTSVTPDIITTNNTEAEFTATIKNEGLLDDTYYIEGFIDGPSGWTGEFTTINGTTPFGQMDSISLTSGSSADVLVKINPNGFNGFAYINIKFTSAGDPGVIATAQMRLVTETGVDFLVIDASGEEQHSNVFVNSLSKFFENFGVVTHDAITPNITVDNFYLIAWIAGDKVPVFSEADVVLLENYLDQGGRLFISGQDIGNDIFGFGAQSTHAADFYNNYLHASFISNAGSSYFITGIASDPIGDGLAFATNTVYNRYLEQIAPFNANATPIFQFSQGPDISSIKAKTDTFAVVYLGFGLEQLDVEDTQDSITVRSVRWLMEDVTVGTSDDAAAPVISYSLNQNYPNPFNPQTTISYSVADAGNVLLKVYDVLGNEVAEVVNNFQQAGNYNVAFDASSLSSGMYIYKLTAGNFTSSRKMIILK